MVVSGIVVEDKMKVKALGRLSIDGAQELKEFLMAMTRQALANHFPIESIQSGKEGRGSVALVVMRHSFRQSSLHGQSRLGAIKSLNLALLVNTQHQSMLGRVQYSPTTSWSFSTNLGSRLSLKERTRWGFSPCSFQIRWILAGLKPTAAAMLRVLQ
jgi:hypothetical protein